MSKKSNKRYIAVLIIIALLIAALSSIGYLDLRPQPSQQQKVKIPASALVTPHSSGL